MLFDDFANKIQETLSRVSKLDVFGDKEFQKALTNVRTALIDADANVKIIDELISKVETRMKDVKIPKRVTKTQMFVKLVHDGLTEILGSKGTAERLLSPPQQQKRFMFVGLQGSGKTTSIAKFAKLILKKFPEAKILLVACDTRRPAAVEQLDILGKRVKCETFTAEEGSSAERVLDRALQYSLEKKFDYVFIDTAGRQIIDDDLMKELVILEKKAKPDEVLLVLDAMTGQEAANVARRFTETVHISGAILTKLDSDTRGGAALSLSTISGCCIAFMGISEDLDGLEPFYPDRIASRILGMGDVVTLVEKAQENVTEEEAKEMAKRMIEAKFTFEDFLKQLSFVSSMGSIGNMLKMVPGVGNKINSEDISKMEKKLKVAKVIIQSMTKEERRNPELFYNQATSKARIERIQKGSGRSQEEIDDFFKTFRAAQVAMKKFGTSAKLKEGMDISNDIESTDFTGNRAQRRKLSKTKDSVTKSSIKKGFGK